jgi:hypothetical protein
MADNKNNPLFANDDVREEQNTVVAFLSKNKTNETTTNSSQTSRS